MMKPEDALKQQTESLSPDAVDWEDRYKRLAAELDNTRKRLLKNAALEIENARDRIVLDMLPLADNLERIVEAGTRDPNITRWLDGVRITLQSFQSSLQKYGVERIEASGQMFDPELHEAVATRESEEQPSGSVLDVVQAGYLREGRLLRPARVVIAA